MKYLIWPVVIIVVCGVANVYAANTSAHAGNHAAGHLGSTAHSSASSQSNATSAGQSPGGGGGRASMVDDYQPWPESEMWQFAKPKFVPYSGE